MSMLGVYTFVKCTNCKKHSIWIQGAAKKPGYDIGDLIDSKCAEECKMNNVTPHEIVDMTMYEQ